MKLKMDKIRTNRFNKSEDCILIEDAKNMGISVSKLIRFYCGFEKIIVNKSELRQTMFYLNKASNNINQIGKAVKVAYHTSRIDTNTFELYLKNIMLVSDVFKNTNNDIVALQDVKYKIDMNKIITDLKYLSSNVNDIAKQLNVANLTVHIEPARYSNAIAKLHMVKKILATIEVNIRNIYVN